MPKYDARSLFNAMTIQQTISTVFSDLGGRASLTMMVDRVLNVINPDHREELVMKGLLSEIRQFFRTQNGDGLPQAPKANPDGEHVQLSLLEVDDYRFIVKSYMDRSDANRNMAQKFADLCLQRHGVLIDLNNPFAA